jgi:aconitate hydratase
MLGGKKEGGYTLDPSGKNVVSIYDAAMEYKNTSTPLVIIAGKEYGTGSSRDWAAKGSNLLGIKVVIAESFERIHRSNLIGMGVLPLIFKGDINRKTLNLKGDEVIDILGVDSSIAPKQDIQCYISRSNGQKEKIILQCGLDTLNEVEYYKSGGILQYVLNKIS